MSQSTRTNEVEAAAQLINGGFSLAKKSMEQILQTPIAIERIEYDDQALDRFALVGGNEVHLLKTELKGELAGACYLIFANDDVEKINHACLPLDISSGKSADSELMKVEFLKEIDNILAASVITEFANALEILAYGDVPSLVSIPSSTLHKYIESEIKKNETVIHSRAIFHGPALSISPHFIWIFQDELLDKIKNISNN